MFGSLTFRDDLETMAVVKEILWTRGRDALNTSKHSQWKAYLQFVPENKKDLSLEDSRYNNNNNDNNSNNNNNIWRYNFDGILKLFCLTEMGFNILCGAYHYGRKWP